SDRAYALARVVQGAQKIENETIKRKAIAELYQCQTLSRPVGQGLIADNVKGSLNVLEALWPALDNEHRKQLRSMLDALLRCYSRANTIGIVVAIENEAKSMEQAFVSENATLKPGDNATVLEHADYYVVVRRGKSLAESLIAAKDLIEKDRAKRLIMLGVAGS